MGGDRSVRRPAADLVTADTYKHVLGDGREVNYGLLLAIGQRARP